MKIIFLDIDGVLNSTETAEFIPAAIENLNHIIKQSSAEIVISSFWNYLYTFDQINDKLAKIGVCKPAIDATTHLEEDHSSAVTVSAVGAKSHEIQSWLTKHDDIDSFVIFEDDPIYISQAHKHYAVIVDPKKGITKEDTEHALITLSLPLPDKIPDSFEDWFTVMVPKPHN